jgi:hypothetical protein
VKLTNQVFDLKEAKLDTINFVLNKKADVRIQIWNCNGYLIRNLFDGKAKKGINYYMWDGKDDAGDKAVNGDYYLTIAAYTNREQVMYDPYELPWGDMVQPEDFIVNLADLRVYYVIPFASLVRIRAGILKEALLYTTIVNWKPRPAGPNVEVWDGYDNSKLIGVAHKENIEYFIQVYFLPENVIIIKNGNPNIKTYSTKRELPLSKGSCRHSYHLREECYDPEVILTFLDVKHKKNGIPLVDENTNLKVELPKDAQKFMENERFEIMLFLDGKLYLEEEMGYLPYKHLLQISDLDQGKHILTIVTASSGDHVGSSSIHFFVDKGRFKCLKKSLP